MAINFRSNTIIKNLRVGPLSGGGNGGGDSFITDGLTAHYDIGNTLSYSGTGNTITDLTGNGNELQLAGLPTGYYQGSGDSAFLRLESGEARFYYLGPVSTTTLDIAGDIDFSYSWWLLQGSLYGGGSDTYLSVNQSSQNSSNFRLNLIYNKPTHPNASYANTYSVSFRRQNGGTTDLVVSPPAGFDYSTDWGNFTITVSAAAGLKLYINGQATTTVVEYDNTAPLPGDIPSGNTFSGHYARYVDGYAQSAIYNRALSSSEVLQNFNALKSRYGY